MKDKNTYSSAYIKKENKVKLIGPEFVSVAKDILSKGFPLRFKASGYSMYPFIKFNDIVTISPVEEQIPKTGDVVALVSQDMKSLVVHRVIKITKNNSYLICGDNNASKDGFFSKQEIIGYVKEIRRKGRRVQFGLGAEKRLIAFLGRIEFLYPCLRIFIRVRNFFKKGSH